MAGAEPLEGAGGREGSATPVPLPTRHLARAASAWVEIKGVGSEPKANSPRATSARLYPPRRLGQVALPLGASVSEVTPVQVRPLWVTRTQPGAQLVSKYRRRPCVHQWPPSTSLIRDPQGLAALLTSTCLSRPLPTGSSPVATETLCRRTRPTAAPILVAVPRAGAVWLPCTGGTEALAVAPGLGQAPSG